jgi:hypothetical protein
LMLINQYRWETSLDLLLLGQVACPFSGADLRYWE